MSLGSQTNRKANRRPARRKRAATRRMRRFEGVLAHLPVVKMDWRAALQGVEVPAVLLPTPWAGSKLLSGLLLAAAISAFTLIHWQDEWYLYNEDIAVVNLMRLTLADIYSAADVDGWNIFWVEPEEVRRRILTHRWIADAQVEIGLPTAMRIRVAERTPVAVWVTNESSYWVTADGVTWPMTSAEAAGPLPQIIDSLGEARARFVESEALMLEPQILHAALDLLAALPELEGKIRYNRNIGLNFPLQNPTVWVYWGDGLEMDAKLDNLAASRTLLSQGQTTAQILDVRFPSRPYIR